MLLSAVSVLVVAQSTSEIGEGLMNNPLLFNPLGISTCSSAKVLFEFLLYEGSTIHNASNQFISCVYFFFVDFAFYPSPETKI